MKQLIVVIALLSYYFHISGLATTNILRLTAGSTLPVLSSKCACDACGTPISPWLQLPMISYLVCRGRCRTCGVRIPVYQLVLEAVIFLGMCLITVVLRFSLPGVILSFGYYEAVRIVTIVLRGKRQKDFLRQYLIAAAQMIPICLLTMFIALLYTVV